MSYSAVKSLAPRRSLFVGIAIGYALVWNIPYFLPQQIKDSGAPLQKIETKHLVVGRKDGAGRATLGYSKGELALEVRPPKGGARFRASVAKNGEAMFSMTASNRKRTAFVRDASGRSSLLMHADQNLRKPAVLLSCSNASRSLQLNGEDGGRRCEVVVDPDVGARLRVMTETGAAMELVAEPTGGVGLLGYDADQTERVSVRVRGDEAAFGLRDSRGQVRTGVSVGPGQQAELSVRDSAGEPHFLVGVDEQGKVRAKLPR